MLHRNSTIENPNLGIYSWELSEKRKNIYINCRSDVDFLSDICFEGYNNQSCVTSIYTVPT